MNQWPSNWMTLCFSNNKTNSPVKVVHSIRPIIGQAWAGENEPDQEYADTVSVWILPITCCKILDEINNQSRCQFNNMKNEKFNQFYKFEISVKIPVKSWNTVTKYNVRIAREAPKSVENIFAVGKLTRKKKRHHLKLQWRAM